MIIKPLSDRVVILPLEQESVTKSGIIIPDTAKEKSHKGKVLVVGEGKFEDGKLLPMVVKVDDFVLYREYAGDEVKVDGQKVIVLKQEDIIAIIQ